MTPSIRLNPLGQKLLVSVLSVIVGASVSCQSTRPAQVENQPLALSVAQVAPAVPTEGARTNRITTLQQAFNIGMATMDSGRFPLDNQKCKVTIQKSENGWLMTVTPVPPTIGGEQILLIKPDGNVVVGFGL